VIPDGTSTAEADGGATRAAVRAFSLIEAMVTIAIVGIIAALALPSVLPLRASAQLLGNSDLVATTLVRARFEAMAQKRCVRFRAETPTTVTLELLNAFDCDEDPGSAPRPDGASPLWVPLLTQPVRLEEGVQVTVIEAPASSPGPAGAPGEIRFRPSGRVFGQDADLTNDSALLEVSSPRGAHEIFVQGNGLICRLKGAQTPVSGPAGRECP
jgi:prepilin-type N-terminal cleavage/methylation domain-containing protein